MENTKENEQKKKFILMSVIGKKDWIELFRPQIIRYSVKFKGN